MMGMFRMEILIFWLVSLYLVMQKVESICFLFLALEDGWHLFRPEEEYGKVVEAFLSGY
jgi:hypothetical protein